MCECSTASTLADRLVDTRVGDDPVTVRCAWVGLERASEGQIERACTDRDVPKSNRVHHAVQTVFATAHQPHEFHGDSATQRLSASSQTLSNVSPPVTALEVHPVGKSCRDEFTFHPTQKHARHDPFLQRPATSSECRCELAIADKRAAPAVLCSRISLIKRPPSLRRSVEEGVLLIAAPHAFAVSVQVPKQ